MGWIMQPEAMQAMLQQKTNSWDQVEEMQTKDMLASSNG